MREKEMERHYEWAIKSAKIDSQKLVKLLENSWEPFAVTTNTIGEPSKVFLRKQFETTTKWVALALKREQISPLVVSLREYEGFVRDGKTNRELEFADSFVKPLADEIEQLI